jgi:hypothetical protein
MVSHAVSSRAERESWTPTLLVETRDERASRAPLIVVVVVVVVVDVDIDGDGDVEVVVQR